MVFNDTSGRQGLIQLAEFWAGLNANDISGDTNLLAVFTNLINRRLDRYLGLLGGTSSLTKIDDTSYNTHPFAIFDILQGQHDYEFLIDEDGNAISDFTSVMILVDDKYKKLDKITLDHPDAEYIMSPNSDDKGVPTRYLEKNNVIFLNPIPDYDKQDGGKVFFKRCPSYFTTTDTTKEPGIPFQFHQMLAIGSALDWLLINKPNYQTLIATTNNELLKWEKEFMTYNELRNPERRSFKPKIENMR